LSNRSLTKSTILPCLPHAPTTTKLELRTAYGPVYRDVLNTPPRPCTDTEIPIIDLSNISSPNLSDRQALAAEIRAAAVGTGFFYVKNHGIEEVVIKKAKEQALSFFRQPYEEKAKIDKSHSRYFNGYMGLKSSNISPGESVDVKESIAWRYEPENDPDHPQPLSSIPPESLSPEDYFDSRVTYPGADGLYNYYPPSTEAEKANNSVGLGSHTDLQLFTLLWQDMIGGLQVLNKEGQWIMAVPVEGTIVVNIGDFMMRLCNDMYKSTVHRVYNRATVERISMPFFFGLNFNCVEGVISTCTDENNPPKYEPISCGDWCQLRFKLENDEFKEKAALEKAPSAVIVKA
ncbi:2OG-Fe(II)oxygenase superfamily protein, partial [Botrytis cinerea]